MKTRTACALALILAGCGGNAYYVNYATGKRIPAYGPTQDPDLASCREEYQRAFAAGPALWMGEIVPNCMKSLGWSQE